MTTRTGLVQTRPTGNGRARGLVGSRVSGRRIESRTFAPPPDLGDVVDQLWVSSWDLPNDAPHELSLLSDPSVNFAFEAGDGTPGSRVVGVWTKLFRRTLTGRGHVRAVKLRPGAVRAFTTLSASELRDRVEPLSTLFRSATRALTQRVLEGDEEIGLGALVDWLRGARRPAAPRADTRDAIALVKKIAESPEITSAAALAEAAGVALRSLQRLFHAEVGAPPKVIIRRYRLQEAALRIERGDAPSLAALAATLGYADQSHLAKDFRNVVGKSPSAFADSVDR